MLIFSYFTFLTHLHREYNEGIRSMWSITSLNLFLKKLVLYLTHVYDSFDSGIALSVNISDCLTMEDAKEVWADIGKWRDDGLFDVVKFQQSDEMGNK